jgi:hypothetical protein
MGARELGAVVSPPSGIGMYRLSKIERGQRRSKSGSPEMILYRIIAPGRRAPKFCSPLRLSAN